MAALDGLPAVPEDGGTSRHPYYGPCDGFGPKGECSQCTGFIERSDGTIVRHDTGEVVRKRPWRVRVAAALRELSN